MKLFLKIIILSLIFSGCRVNAQQKFDILVENGILISVDDIKLDKYQLEIESLNLDASEITLEDLLCFATNECDFSLTARLIRKGANPNCKCENYLDHVITNVALCENEYMELAKLLLENGANINGADEDNESFLSYSTGDGKPDLVKYLLANGANLEQRDENSRTGCLPVHSVATIDELKLYMEYGADLEVTCNNGRNLFHFVARENYLELARFLIENKLVNPFRKDNNGEAPIDYANRSNNIEMSNLLNSLKK